MSARYEILDTLSRPDKAPSIWKAWDTKLQRYVALRKIVEPGKDADESAVAAAAALCSLQHPNIVSVYNVDEQPAPIGTVAVMEYLNGSDMFRSIQRGVLTETDFLKVAQQILEGLAVAHKSGILHRQINPGSVMLTWLPDDSFLAKLLDFGFGGSTAPKPVGDSEDERSLIGACYLSPEALLGHGYDARSDLYSLGCVFYFTLTGEHPFNGKSFDAVRQNHLRQQQLPLKEAREDVSSKYLDWANWLAARQPDDRPRDAGMALEVLRQMISGVTNKVPDRNTGLQRVSTNDTKGTTRMPAGTAGKLPTTERTGRIQARMGMGTGSVLLPGQKNGGKANHEEEATDSIAASKKKLPVVVIGSALGAAALAAGVFWLVNRGNNEQTTIDPETNTGNDAKAKIVVNVPESKPPVFQHLAVWLRASDGAMTETSTQATPGQKVSTWVDLAETLGGGSRFVASSTSGQPKLVEHENTHGLFGKHVAVRFKPGESLHTLLEKSEVVEQGLLDENFTLFIVGKVDNDPSGRQQRIVAAQSSKSKKAWDIGWEKASYNFGLRKLPDGVNRQKLLDKALGNFQLSSLWRDKTKDLGARLLDSKGTISKALESVPANFEHGSIKLLRLGAVADLSAEGKDADYLNGEIAEVLIYRRALEARDVQTVEKYLLRRYFGL